MTQVDAHLQSRLARTSLVGLSGANPSLVDQWFSAAGNPPEADLARSGAPARTIRDLLNLIRPADRDEFFDMSLDYGATEGTERLRNAIVASGQAQDPREVTVTNGAVEALLLACAASLDDRNTIAIGVPAYDTVVRVATATGARVNSIEIWHPGQDHLCLEGFSDAVIAESSSLVINTPHNPTGLRPDRSELAHLARRCRTFDTILIVDEVALGTLDPWATSFVMNDEFDKGMSIVIGDVSKSLGLGGLRMGWLTTQSPSLTQRFSEIHDLTTLGSSGPSQFLAATALRYRKQLTPSALAAKNLETLVRWIADKGELQSLPTDGLVAFPRIDLSIPSIEFARLARQVGVSVMPGSLFGVEGHLRLGLGVEARIFENALTSLGSLLSGQ